MSLWVLQHYQFGSARPNCTKVVIIYPLCPRCHCHITTQAILCNNTTLAVPSINQGCYCVLRIQSPQPHSMPSLLVPRLFLLIHGAFIGIVTIPTYAPSLLGCYFVYSLLWIQLLLWIDGTFQSIAHHRLGCVNEPFLLVLQQLFLHIHCVLVGIATIPVLEGRASSLFGCYIVSSIHISTSPVRQCPASSNQGCYCDRRHCHISTSTLSSLLMPRLLLHINISLLGIATSCFFRLLLCLYPVPL